MKNHLYLILAGLALLMGGTFACTDLEILAPCSPETSIILDTSPDCTFPCERTFRLQNVENLAGARFNWTLSRNSAPIENATSQEFTSSLDAAGNYLVTALISFDFSGCDQSLEESFTINGDLPIARIIASEMECIVGNCNIKLWQENQFDDSWIWSLPNDPDNYQNQDTVCITLNDAPGEYQVVLEATNFNGTVTDTITIIVKPQTFVLRGDEPEMAELDKILCIRENTDGSFSAIGNNEVNTHTFSISRTGTYISNSLDKHNSLPNFYSNPIGRSCEIIDGKPIVIGEVSFENMNTDFYLASFATDFSLGTETGFRVGTNGNERTFGVTGSFDQGFVLCGNTRKQGNPPSAIEGMAFVELNESFVTQNDVALFTDNPGNLALDIITLSNEYVVSGIRNNQGCYFRLNPSLDIIPGSFNFLAAGISAPFLTKINEESFLLISRDGNTTVLQVFENSSLISEKRVSLTTIRAASSLEDGKLALAGYRGTSNSRQPLLLVFDSTNLSASPSIEEVFLTTQEEGEFLNVTLSPDGGYLLGGKVGEGSDSRPLMVRTNSSGKL